MAEGVDPFTAYLTAKSWERAERSYQASHSWEASDRKSITVNHQDVISWAAAQPHSSDSERNLIASAKPTVQQVKEAAAALRQIKEDPPSTAAATAVRTALESKKRPGEPKRRLSEIVRGTGDPGLTAQLEAAERALRLAPDPRRRPPAGPPRPLPSSTPPAQSTAAKEDRVSCKHELVEAGGWASSQPGFEFRRFTCQHCRITRTVRIDPEKPISPASLGKSRRNRKQTTTKAPKPQSRRTAPPTTKPQPGVAQATAA